MNLIAAIDENFAIGNKGDLLCHLPEDLKRFKELTLNKTVIMGYKTLLSLPGGLPLKNRRNIVLTTKNITVEGATVVHSLQEALRESDKDTFVIGGGSVYRQFLPFCEKAYLTHIRKGFEADAYFPALGENWKLIEESAQKEHDGIGFSFAVYKNTDHEERIRRLMEELHPDSKPDDSSARIMSCNILHYTDPCSAASEYLYTERTQMLCGCIRRFAPDLVGLQEAHPAVQAQIAEILGEEYRFTEVAVPEGRNNYTPILYRKDRLREISAHFHGFGDRGAHAYPYAIFEDLQTKDKLVCVNLHFHWDEKERMAQAQEVNAVLRKLKKVHPHTPIIVTGDFNTTRKQPDFQALVDHTELASACRIAHDTSDRGATWHKPFCWEEESLSGEIDHICVNTDTVRVLTYRRVADPFIVMATDHYPIYADVEKIKDPLPLN